MPWKPSKAASSLAVWLACISVESCLGAQQVVNWQGDYITHIALRESMAWTWLRNILFILFMLHVFGHILYDVRWLLRSGTSSAKCDKNTETDVQATVEGDIFVSQFGRKYHKVRGCPGLNSASQHGVTQRSPCAHCSSSTQSLSTTSMLRQRTGLCGSRHPGETCCSRSIETATCGGSPHPGETCCSRSIDH